MRMLEAGDRNDPLFRMCLGALLTTQRNSARVSNSWLTFTGRTTPETNSRYLHSELSKILYEDSLFGTQVDMALWDLVEKVIPK